MSSRNETIYVSSRHIGSIIGKGGSKIKELSENFNCRINIKKDQAENDETPITIEGSDRDISKCIRDIKDITNRPMQKRNYDDDGNNRNSRNYSRHDESDYKKSSRSYNDDREYRKRGDDDWSRSDNRNGSSYSRSDYRNDPYSNNNDRGKSWRNDSNDHYRDNGSKSRAHNNDDWGEWGSSKADDYNDGAGMKFGGNNDFDSYTRYIPQSSDNYVPDDDWGIPNGFEEEKPSRRRPANADMKMRATKDKTFYPVIKNFYREHPEVERMSEEQKNAFLLAKNNIMIKEVDSEEKSSFSNFGNSNFEPDPEELIDEIPVPKRVPNPIRSFEEAFYEHPDILKEIYKQGFKDPSPIQCIAWPLLMMGRDFIGVAQTGTGKTLAFLLPAFIHIEGQKKRRENRVGPTVLILSPTRELAIQIQNEVQKYTYHDIDSVVCYGGSDKREQIYQLKDNPEIVVGTPGRLVDLKDSGILNFKDVSYLVLDEADRMLDMGFEIQVVNLIYSVRRQRQTVMTSATWPYGVQRIALTHMKDPVQVNVGTLDLNACHTVSQYIEKLGYEDQKMERLCEILSAILPEDKIIIFVGKKSKCRDLSYDLLMKRTAGNLGPKGAVRACEIHGDLDQQEREIALRMMRKGERNVMIATDVASRGLDISDLTKVINYDFPRNIEEYVHRVGRTGRAGRTGESYTFMNHMDSKHASELIRILEDANQEVASFLPDLVKQHQDFRVSGNRFGGRGRGRGNGGGGFNRDRGGGGGGGFNRDRGGFGGGRQNFNDDRVSNDDSQTYICEENDDENWGNWLYDNVHAPSLFKSTNFLTSTPNRHVSQLSTPSTLINDEISEKWDQDYEDKFKVNEDYPVISATISDDEKDRILSIEHENDINKSLNSLGNIQITETKSTVCTSVVDSKSKTATNTSTTATSIISAQTNDGDNNKIDVTVKKVVTVKKEACPPKTDAASTSIKSGPYIFASKDQNLYPIYKKFYQEHPNVAKLTTDEVEKILLDNNNTMIKELYTYPLNIDYNDQEYGYDDDVIEDEIDKIEVTPGIPKPVQLFSEVFWQNPILLKIVSQMGFTQPSPIQSIGWPCIMGGRDFIGIAQTGTGKTVTFLLPAILHIEGQVKPLNLRRGPTVLILSPTRELAQQIEVETVKVLSMYNKEKQTNANKSDKQQNILRCCCCYGGSDKRGQIQSLRLDPAIVVGTPGRLNDLVDMGYLCLQDVSYLVLDEADRMLDMGFEKQIIRLTTLTRKHRQSIMTSATWPELVRTIAQLYMDHPIQVNIGSLDLIACDDVDQEIRLVENTHKTTELESIVRAMEESDKIIVFVTRKIQCRSITRHLEYMINRKKLGPYAAVCQINGDMTQESREESLGWFKDGYCNILIATNVASRGLDISDITCVVNYDFPNDIEEYVHRVGRTGRAGRKGRAITFINDDDHRHGIELRKILLKSKQNAPDWLLNLRSVRPCQQSMYPTFFTRENKASCIPDNQKVDNIKNQLGFLKSDDESEDWNYQDSDFQDDLGGGFFAQFQKENDPLMKSNSHSAKKPKKKNQKKKTDFGCINYGRGRPVTYLPDELVQDEFDDYNDDGDFFDDFQAQNDPSFDSESVKTDEYVGVKDTKKCNEIKAKSNSDAISYVEPDIVIQNNEDNEDNEDDEEDWW